MVTSNVPHCPLINAVPDTGKLYSDCSEFDSSLGREPFTFTLGRGEVIAGWDKGLKGMCVGEKRKLTIPSGMAYGDEGAGADIPGGATLIFDVELLGIKDGPPAKPRKKKSKKKKSKHAQETGQRFIKPDPAEIAARQMEL